MCEEELVEHLTVEAACDILSLADIHSAEQLKAHTLDFIMLWVLVSPHYPSLHVSLTHAEMFFFGAFEWHSEP